MFVREAGIQVLQDFFGVYSESSALNEYLGCINALSAALRALCGAHKAVDCDISESVLVIASYAEHDRVAIGGNFVYLFRPDGVSSCSGECEIVKDGCYTPVSQ